MNGLKSVFMEKIHLLGLCSEILGRTLIHGKGDKMQFSDDSVGIKLSYRTACKVAGMSA